MPPKAVFLQTRGEVRLAWVQLPEHFGTGAGQRGRVGFFNAVPARHRTGAVGASEDQEISRIVYDGHRPPRAAGHLLELCGHGGNGCLALVLAQDSLGIHIRHPTIKNAVGRQTS